MKMLTKTSNNKIIGTISIGGNIKDKPETEIAEKPKPLKPLTIDAIRIINAKITKLFKSKLTKFKSVIK